MEHIPAWHAAVVGMQYPGRVSSVWESEMVLVLDLTEYAPGRSPRLPALLLFNQTVTPELARRLAPGDPVEAVLIAVHLHPNHERVVASLPANPAWLTWNDETVRRLARHIRGSGEFGLLPVLADALEDAGCRDAALLDHCRLSEPGGRSWVVELLATQG